MTQVIVQDWMSLKPHLAAQIFPMMSSDELTGLLHSIKTDGFQAEHPIVLLDGKILDGRSRHAACRSLAKSGIEVAPIFVEFDAGADAMAFVLRENLHRRHLTREDYRRLIVERLKTTPERSNTAIARELKVDPHTVIAAREKLEKDGTIPKVEKLVGADGVQRRMPANRSISVSKPDQAKGSRTAPKPLSPQPAPEGKIPPSSISLGRDIEAAAKALANFYTPEEWTALINTVDRIFKGRREYLRAITQAEEAPAPPKKTPRKKAVETPKVEEPKKEEAAAPPVEAPVEKPKQESPKKKKSRGKAASPAAPEGVKLIDVGESLTPENQVIAVDTTVTEENDAEIESSA